MVMTCNSCNKEFEDEAQQKLHYRSEWHRYNLKRKVAGVPGVTEELFLARQAALAEEREKNGATPMLYACTLCSKEYRSSKAHAQHLNSRGHAIKVSQELDPSTAGITIIKPFTSRTSGRPTPVSRRQTELEGVDEESEDSGDEWEEVNSDDDLQMTSEALSNMHVDGSSLNPGIEENDDIMEIEDIDPSCCFICDLKHNSIENCMAHMHKQHGFFIPDVEYLKYPKDLLTYVALKVKRDYMCLYCSDRCQPFQSWEAVKKHMIAKGHCKLRYGDGDDDEDVDLEEFYDYSSSYVDADGKQLVASDDMANDVELGSGGSELIITRKSDRGVLVRTLGSREFLRYYRQKPRPSLARDVALAISLASRYRSMGLATVQSREQIVRMKVLREMNKHGVETMRSKLGMKSNVIRNLPKNVTY